MAKTGRKPLLKNPKQTFVTMEKDKFKELEKLAYESRTSINELIRRAIDDKYFEQPSGKAAEEE